MCLHNFTLHNGCGHKSPCPGPREYTLCETARSRLPRPPPPPPPPKDNDVVVATTATATATAPAPADANATVTATTTATTPPRASTDNARSSSPRKRLSVLEKRASRLQRLGTQYIKRMPSVSIGGNGITITKSTYNPSSESGEGGSRSQARSSTTTTTTPATTDGTSNTAGASATAAATLPPQPSSPFDEYAGISPLDVAIALCEGDDLKKVDQREARTDVCERCKRVINEMRWLVQAYDEKKNIKGCKAYWYVDVKRPDDPGTADWAKEK